MAEKATYIDENGNKKTGVTDYYKTAAANAQGQMEAQIAANAADAEAARQRTAESIAYQMSDNNAQIGKSNRQAYQDYKNAMKNLPEQLNGMGITGGLAESSRVKLETGYGSRVNENELARRKYEAMLREQQAQQDYQTAAAQRAADQAARNTYYSTTANLGAAEHQEDYAAAQLADQRAYAASQLADQRAYEEAQRASQLADQRAYAASQLADQRAYEEAQRADQRQYAASQLADQRAYEEAQRAAQLADQRDYAAQQEEKAKGEQQALEAAKLNAQIGDYSGYVALGYMTPEQAEAYRKAWIKENPDMARTLGYTTGGGGSYVPAAAKEDNGAGEDYDGLSDAAKRIVENLTEAAYRGERDLEYIRNNYEQGAKKGGTKLYTAKDVEAAFKYLES